jgi:hypothetical protein
MIDVFTVQASRIYCGRLVILMCGNVVCDRRAPRRALRASQFLFLLRALALSSHCTHSLATGHGIAYTTSTLSPFPSTQSHRFLSLLWCAVRQVSHSSILASCYTLQFLDLLLRFPVTFRPVRSTGRSPLSVDDRNEDPPFNRHQTLIISVGSEWAISGECLMTRLGVPNNPIASILSSSPIVSMDEDQDRLALLPLALDLQRTPGYGKPMPL